MIPDEIKTKNPRGRPPEYSQIFEDLAEAGAAAGLKPPELRAEALKLARKMNIEKVPSLKWFERRQPPKEARQWSLGHSSGAEAVVVLDFLAWLARATRGGLRVLTESQAEWIVRLSSVAPDLGNYIKWRFALAYTQRVTKNEPTFDLDLWMAFKPWTKDGSDNYQEARREKWLPDLPLWLVSRRPDGMTLRDFDWQIKMQEKVAEMIGSKEGHDVQPEG